MLVLVCVCMYLCVCISICVLMNKWLFVAASATEDASLACTSMSTYCNKLLPIMMAYFRFV